MELWNSFAQFLIMDVLCLFHRVKQQCFIYIDVCVPHVPQFHNFVKLNFYELKVKKSIKVVEELLTFLLYFLWNKCGTCSSICGTTSAEDRLHLQGQTILFVVSALHIQKEHH